MRRKLSIVRGSSRVLVSLRLDNPARDDPRSIALRRERRAPVAEADLRLRRALPILRRRTSLPSILSHDEGHAQRAATRRRRRPAMY